MKIRQKMGFGLLLSAMVFAAPHSHALSLEEQMRMLDQLDQLDQLDRQEFKLLTEEAVQHIHNRQYDRAQRSIEQAKRLIANGQQRAELEKVSALMAREKQAEQREIQRERELIAEQQRLERERTAQRNHEMWMQAITTIGEGVQQGLEQNRREQAAFDARIAQITREAEQVHQARRAAEQERQQRIAMQAEQQRTAQVAQQNTARQQAEQMRQQEQARQEAARKAEIARQEQLKRQEQERRRAEEEAKNRPVPFKEGIALCEETSKERWTCYGPAATSREASLTGTTVNIVTSACGGDDVRFLGTTGIYRAYGCGFGVHPSDTKKDIPKRFGVYVPGQAVFHCNPNLTSPCKTR